MIAGYLMQDEEQGMIGLGDLGAIQGTIDYGPGGRVGLRDAFGNFYYFKSANLEHMYPPGTKLESVAEDYVSITDPRLMVQGQLPWTLPGVTTWGPVATAPQQQDSPKKKKWYQKPSTYLLAGAGLLGLYALGKYGQTGNPGYQVVYGNPYPASQGRINYVAPQSFTSPRLGQGSNAVGTASLYQLSGNFDEYDSPNSLSGPLDTARDFYSRNKGLIQTGAVVLAVIALWTFLDKRR